MISKGNSSLPDIYLATALKNIESLGFTFSAEVLEVIRTLSVDEFVLFYKKTMKNLRAMVGDHVTYRPMYPNFPKQVMELAEAELYINAIIHYMSEYGGDITGVRIPDRGLPAYEEAERFPLMRQEKVKIIGLGSQEELQTLISQLIASHTSLSETDRQDIEWAIRTYEAETLFGKIIPEQIPMKENVAFVVAALLRYQKATAPDLAPLFKTATDVLRLAVALSEGNHSLAGPVHFRKFKRSERKMLLGLLEGLSHITEDMWRHRMKWIRLGEILHPGEYKAKFPTAYNAFYILRNNKSFQTFESKVQAAIERRAIVQCASLLSARPGEFARKLDLLIRLSNDSDESAFVMNLFSDVANQIATPVLLQVMSHFKERHRDKEWRAFFPKGQAGKAIVIPDELRPLPFNSCMKIVAICETALQERFKDLPPLGKVVVDEHLKEQNVPFSQRSASKSLRTLTRGSKLDLPADDTVRFFAWWKEGFVNDGHTGRVDLDLSAVMYDADWNYMDHISYTHLRAEDYQAAHSGDIVSAPNGACEFIDLHIPSIVQYGGRYIVAQLYAFSDQSFMELPECFVGWMSRNAPDSGEIFEPATVVDKVDIAANTRIAIPIILDLQERKLIWCDLALKSEPYFANNVEGNQGGIVAMGRAMTSLVKPTLYDLFLLHAVARGEVVDDSAEADIVFSFDGTVTPYDIERIMAEFLI